ncbi:MULTISPECIES: baseplate hub protein [unclassified Saccharibacter]|uniref:baseplate hub protein n=1 Tax=unclassified Saccharibacter TaxID=2648722 RepID=UPI001326F184|nr:MULTISPECIES: hypothetical protein [unclassified Saccharibacter]MXV35663.1 hypothetical protein [Saccharibacter sp. EH611]MXV58277.1 hypothetical protein [Saccharibacter sp. EH70]MXV66426.1 hypothetical protein [Saccharibacter sp. EH60]
MSDEFLKSRGLSTTIFQKRRLAVELYIPPGTKKVDYHQWNSAPSELEGDTILMEGFRTEAQIVCSGQQGGVESQICVYNPPQDILRAVAGYGNNGMIFQVGDNNYPVEIRLYSIITGNNVFKYTHGINQRLKQVYGKEAENDIATLIYRGGLVNSVANMSSLPDPFLAIQSNTMDPIRVIPAPVMSYKGAVKVADIFQKIAKDLGLRFVNHGVETMLVNPYFTGNYTDQLDKCSLEGFASYIIDGRTLSIRPNVERRLASEGDKQVINKHTGLLGVPSFNNCGIVFKLRYRPSLSFGDVIRVESETLPNGTGYYVVRAVTHHLSSEMPDGPWESEIEAYFANLGNLDQARARIG